MTVNCFTLLILTGESLLSRRNLDFRVGIQIMWHRHPAFGEFLEYDRLSSLLFQFKKLAGKPALLLAPDVGGAVSAKIPILFACLVVVSQRRQVRDGQLYTKNTQARRLCYCGDGRDARGNKKAARFTAPL